MKAKEIEVRLEVTKLLISISDKESLDLQATALKSTDNSQLSEIATLLNGSNYRQALYLVKNYMTEHFDPYSEYEDGEKVLDIEDMLRMSPLAQETINDYRALAYDQDDLDRFASNITTKDTIKEQELPEAILEDTSSIEQVIKGETKAKELKEEHIAEQAVETKESQELHSKIETVDKDVPLDEISAQVLGKQESKSRAKVLSKYKTLRSKFAKREVSDEKSEELKKSSVAQSVITKAKGLTEKITSRKQAQEDVLNVTSPTKLSKEEKPKKPEEKPQKVENKEVTNKKVENKELKKKEIKKLETQTKEKPVVNEDVVYKAMPNIEKKFREAFTLYPPNKESDVWIEEVVKFLKNVSKNSYSEKDVESFLNEYHYYVDKNKLAQASQVLLLAAATESKFAKFTLARELFSGKTLHRNLQKSFTIIKSLANVFYPEAVCDLAQFYEYGIGVPKDKKVALKLYEKAFEVGSTRASKHINRIKESSGFLSSLLNRA